MSTAQQVWEHLLDDQIALLTERFPGEEIAFILPSGVDYWPDHKYRGYALFVHSTMPPGQLIGGKWTAIKNKLAELYANG